MMEKAVEWKAPHFFVMDGGIKKAYDFVSQKALQKRHGNEGCTRS